MELKTYTTPWRVTMQAYSRKDTCDENTLISCITEDEYQVNMLPKDGIAIDMGGYIGGCSMALASKGYKVYMVEPLPENINLATKNIMLNNFIPPVTVYENAVASKSNQIIPIYYNETSTEHGRNHKYIGMPIQTKDSGEKIDVKTITLEDIFNQNEIKKCDFLKIDIEGGEWDIFKNIPDYILDKIDRIAVEIDGTKENPTNTNAFLKLLKDKFTDNSKEYFPKWCAPGEWVHGYYINKNI